MKWVNVYHPQEPWSIKPMIYTSKLSWCKNRNDHPQQYILIVCRTLNKEEITNRWNKQTLKCFNFFGRETHSEEKTPIANSTQEIHFQVFVKQHELGVPYHSSCSHVRFVWKGRPFFKPPSITQWLGSAKGSWNKSVDFMQLTLRPIHPPVPAVGE